MSEWAIRSKKRFAHFLWAMWVNHSWSLIFGERPERFAHIAHFWWATWAIHSHRSPKNREWAICSFFNKKTYIKHIKKQDFRFFSQNFFISSERPERITHGHLFVLSDLSDLLMVAYFLWATWAICSRSLICLERSEWIPHSRSFDLSEMSEWANERFPALGDTVVKQR